MKMISAWKYFFEAVLLQSSNNKACIYAFSFLMNRKAPPAVHPVKSPIHYSNKAFCNGAGFCMKEIIVICNDENQASALYK